MQYLLYLSVLLVLLQLCTSAQVPLQPSPRIVNGTAANVEETKHQVSIRLKKYDSNFGSGHICGGTLIGPRKVLTAAHCLFDAGKKKYRKASEFVVVMGTLNRYLRVNGTIVSDVTSIAYMNTFSDDTMVDDVGLMFLKTGLPANRTHLTIAPIALTNSTPAAGTTCTVSGWGKTNENASLSPILLAANVSIISRTTCALTYGSGIQPGMMCAGRLLGGTDSCQGDSGGPLVQNNTLVGIVSWGTGCARPGLPGVYTDVNYYREWIESRNGALSRLGMSWTVLLLCAGLLALRSSAN